MQIFSYYISGVFKDPQGVIQEVLIHLPTDNGDQITQGQRVSVGTVINLINVGHNVFTIRWDYNLANYGPGAKVIVVPSFNGKIIRTVPNAGLQDNLDNLLNMWNLGYK